MAIFEGDASKSKLQSGACITKSKKQKKTSGFLHDNIPLCPSSLTQSFAGHLLTFPPEEFRLEQGLTAEGEGEAGQGGLRCDSPWAAVGSRAGAGRQADG